MNCERYVSTCPCKYHNEVGMDCLHAKAVLLDLGELGLGSQWVDERFHLTTYGRSYRADIPGMPLLAGKLKPKTIMLHQISSNLLDIQVRKERRGHVVDNFQDLKEACV